MGDGGGNLPPGFRFYPTDEELVVHFLHRRPCSHLIPDLHLFPYDPWDLQGKAFSQGQKCYFYSRRTQARITQSGHWRPTGLDHPISSNARKVGSKKSFVFYMGHPSDQPSWPTNWILHEYRLLSDNASAGTTSNSAKSRSKSDHSRWVICKVYEQTAEDDDDANHNSNETELSCLDEVFLSMDDYDEISFPS